MKLSQLPSKGKAVTWTGEEVTGGSMNPLKDYMALVSNCSQGGVRGGAATFFYPVWHAEFESLIVLKNNRGVEENRVRQVDYGVQLNGFFYEKLIKGERIHFFSPHDVPDLYEAFFADQDKFAKLYKEAVQNNLATGSLPAVEVFTQIMQERAGTGRIYIQNVDHCNNHSPFNPEVAPIRQSNLCLEIALPTEPVELNGEGLIALCTLAAVNVLTVNTPAKMKAATNILVRALDAILDYQDYPLPQAKRHSELYRPLGIGIINFASALAEQGYTYSGSEGNNFTHELMECFQYHLMSASVELAKEKGACAGMDHLSRMILPVDTYKQAVDEVHNKMLVHDWNKLHNDIKNYGLRNATVSAFMPSETSSQISNSTNGIEPPRELVSTKQSKDGMLKQVVPLLGSAKYETYWDMVAKGNKGNLEKIGIMQKFVCQAISANIGYDPQVFGGQVPLQVMLQDLLYAYKLGIKTLYYHNTRDSIDIDAEDDSSCDSGGCKI